MSAMLNPLIDAAATFPKRPTRSPSRNERGELTCLHTDCRPNQPTFKRLCEFNKHMDKHDRPYKCNNNSCVKNFGFTYAGGLLRHQREVHSMHRVGVVPFNPHPSHNLDARFGSSKYSMLNEPQIVQHSTLDANFLPEQVPIKTPATRLITQQQLIDKVKCIYAGLVMVEKKCVEIVARQLHSSEKSYDQQRKDFVALCEILKQENHNPSCVSQWLTELVVWRRLEFAYREAAGVRRGYFHASPEHLSPGSSDLMEHMLDFIDRFYSMMVLTDHCDSMFAEIWNQRLDELAKYRMLIQSIDSFDGDIWAERAKLGYSTTIGIFRNTNRIPRQLSGNLAQFDASGRLFDSSFHVDENFPRSPWRGHGSITALEHEDSFGAQNTDLFSPGTHGTKRSWSIHKIVDLSQCMLSRFGPSTRLWAFSTMMKSALCQEMGQGKESVHNGMSENKIASFVESLTWWILWSFLVLLIPLVSPKFKFPNETGTSFIIAFVFAILKSAAGPTNGPTFWTVVSSGISFGSTAWLAMATVSRNNSVFVHIIRYFGLAALLYDALCNSKLGDQNRRLDLSMTVPELSVLGSVLVNALYNEKMKQVVELMEATWGGLLAILRLQRIPLDDIERAPHHNGDQRSMLASVSLQVHSYWAYRER